MAWDTGLPPLSECGIFYNEAWPEPIPPQSITRGITIVLDSSGFASISADNVYNGSTDLCRIESLSLSQTDFNRWHVGPNTLILTVSDKSGNTSTAIILVMVEYTDQQLSIMQPDCENPTGTIEVDVRSGTDTYSVGNGVSFQESNFKEVFLSGNYINVVKTAVGCTTDVAVKTDDQPLVPSRTITSASGPDTDTILVSDSAYACQ